MASRLVLKDEYIKRALSAERDLRAAEDKIREMVKRQQESAAIAWVQLALMLAAIVLLVWK